MTSETDSPTAIQETTDPPAAGTVSSPWEAVEQVCAAGDAAGAYDLAPLLAGMERAEYAKAKVRLREAFGRALNLTDLNAAVREARSVQPQKDNRPWTGRRVVVNDGQLSERLRLCVNALAAANDPPDLYVRGGLVCRLARDPASGRVAVQTLTARDAPAMQEHLSRAAEFLRKTADGLCDCDPPRSLAETVLTLRDLPFPPLQGVVDTPVLRPDGTILERAGYDPASLLYYAPDPGLVLPPVANDPNGDELASALAFLSEAFGEFPYEDEASRAHVLALLLSLVMRPAIDGPVPLAVIDAPSQGTGKSLLASAVCQVATGRAPAVMTAPGRGGDEEWRKRITACLLEGSQAILLDNLSGALENASLAAVLTAREWGDRKLGVSRTVRVPARAVWLATGNNVSLAGDLARRCYWIRLNAGTARPWTRSGFRHPDLLGWLRRERGRLLWALLTVARHWFARGKPGTDSPVLGSFEDWRRVIGGALSAAGISHFLGNLDRMHEAADGESAQLAAFFSAWHELYGDRAVTARELADCIAPGQRGGPLRDALPEELATGLDKGPGNLTRRLGFFLRSRRDGVFGDLRLRTADRHERDRVRLWKVTGIPG